MSKTRPREMRGSERKEKIERQSSNNNLIRKLHGCVCVELQNSHQVTYRCYGNPLTCVFDQVDVVVSEKEKLTKGG